MNNCNVLAAVARSYTADLERRAARRRQCAAR
jgi:hypothetical protein